MKKEEEEKEQLPNGHKTSKRRLERNLVSMLSIFAKHT